MVRSSDTSLIHNDMHLGFCNFNIHAQMFREMGECMMVLLIIMDILNDMTVSINFATYFKWYASHCIDHALFDIANAV